MTPEEIREITNKLEDLGLYKLADKFVNNPEGFDYSVLERYPNFINKYKNVADFKVDKNKIMSELYNQFDGSMPTVQRIEALKDKYPWLNESKLKEWFDKTNEFKKFYEQERDIEAGKLQRKKEIEDEWFLQNLLASEYSKQRYIDDPNASIFGKEGNFNPYSKEGQDELTDVILGSTATAADMLPGARGLIGPTIRTARDVYHYGSDSPYKKSGKEILRDAGLDYGTNAGAWLLANARKGAKGANELSSTDVKRAINFANEDKAVKEGLKTMTSGVNHIPSIPDLLRYRSNGMEDPFNDIILKNTVMDLPESSMKRDLMPLVSNIKERPINRGAVQDVINQYTRESMKPYQTTMRNKVKESRFLPEEARYGSDYLESAISSVPFEDLSYKDKLSYLLNRASGEINKGRLGQVLVQEGANVMGRQSGKPNVVETPAMKKEREDTINRLISDYSLLWNKKSPPPEAKDNPLIKEAWTIWSKE